MPNIVFLDSFVLNPGDLDWGVLVEQGQLTVYERTPSAEVVARAAEAEVIILNKVRINYDWNSHVRIPSGYTPMKPEAILKLFK